MVLFCFLFGCLDHNDCDSVLQHMLLHHDMSITPSGLVESQKWYGRLIIKVNKYIRANFALGPKYRTLSLQKNNHSCCNLYAIAI